MGVGVVVSGVVDENDQATFVAAIPEDIPVLVEPAELPAPAPTPTPTATPTEGPDPFFGLGPPPGPQNDIAPPRTAAPQDRYAFLVGVQNYRPPTKDTIASVNDVLLIRDTLLASGWQSQNIRIITDEQATGQAIRDGMAWLARNSEAGRTFSLFHFSGHVKQFGGQREALWPVDRDWVRDSAFAALVNRIQGKAWIDIAGCEAGSFMPGIPSADKLFSGSSTAVQKSYEYPPWRTSVWTGLLFGQAPISADANGDGTVVVGEALRYSAYYAQRITLKQKPYGRQSPQFAGDGARGWTLANPPA